MQARTIGEYGGPYVDASTVTNPTTQLAASKANRLMEDVAQLTRTGYLAIATVRHGGGAPPSLVTHATVWGDGASSAPTVTQTGVGEFRLDFPATQTDGVGAAEPLAFAFAHVTFNSFTFPGIAMVPLIGSNSVTVSLYEAMSGLPADLNATVTVWIR